MSDGATGCLIALGGNQGPVGQTFERALGLLEQRGCRVLDRSRCYRSEPMGAEAGSVFTNAAARISTHREPLQLLELLQETEEACGRQRTVHWGPRTLDLDLLFNGQEVLESPRLIVPHPGLWYRRFVLEPLLEIAPDVVHPQNGLTIRQLWERMQQRPLVIDIEGDAAICDDLWREDQRQVQIRSVVSSQSVAGETSSAFCRLQSDPAAARASAVMQVDSENFTVVVHPDELRQTLEAVIVAAVGELIR